MTFRDYLLGPTTNLPLFLASVLFAAIGIFLVLLAGTTLRRPNSPHSPFRFSWTYLWSDNARRIYASLLTVLLTIRFMPEVLGWELSPWKALCVGMGWDTLFLIIKQRTVLLDPPKPKP